MNNENSWTSSANCVKLKLVSSTLVESCNKYRLKQTYKTMNNTLRCICNSQAVVEIIPSKDMTITKIEIMPSVNQRDRKFTNGRVYAVGEINDIEVSDNSTFSVIVEFELCDTVKSSQIIIGASIQIESLLAASTISKISTSYISEEDVSEMPTIAMYTGNNLASNVGLC